MAEDVLQMHNLYYNYDVPYDLCGLKSTLLLLNNQIYPLRK